MATLGELRTDLRLWTSTHKNTNVLPDLVCDECINGTIALMQQSHLWRGQETTSIPLTYPGDTESILLPVNFVAQRAVYQQTPDGPIPLLAYLEKTQRDVYLRDHYTATGPRDAEYPQIAPIRGYSDLGTQYAIWAERLYLLPPPTESLPLILDYWARLPPLSDPVRANFFTDRYAAVVRYGALADAYTYLHVDDRSTMMRQLFDAMLARAILDDKTTMLAGGSTERGA